MTHLTETEAEKVGAYTARAIPQHIVDAAKKVVVDDLGIDIPGNLQEVYIDVIADAIFDAVLQERSRDLWQPIATAPKNGEAVDLWGVNHLHYAKTGRRATDVTFGPVRDWMGNERNDWQHGQGEDFEPTHWMRRPAAPKAEG